MTAGLSIYLLTLPSLAVHMACRTTVSTSVATSGHSTMATIPYITSTQSCTGHSYHSILSRLQSRALCQVCIQNGITTCDTHALVRHAKPAFWCNQTACAASFLKQTLEVVTLLLRSSIQSGIQQ